MACVTPHALDSRITSKSAAFKKLLAAAGNAASIQRQCPRSDDGLHVIRLCMRCGHRVPAADAFCGHSCMGAVAVESPHLPETGSWPPDPGPLLLAAGAGCLTHGLQRCWMPEAH